MTESKPYTTDRRQIPHDEWIAEAERRFGSDAMGWKFVCPRCETEQSAADFKAAGVPRERLDGQLAFSCIGRHTDKKGCDWTLGGLFQIHTLEVLIDGKPRPTFEFAEAAS
jgi:hypothetical protein